MLNEHDAVALQERLLRCERNARFTRWLYAATVIATVLIAWGDDIVAAVADAVEIATNDGVGTPTTRMQFESGATPTPIHVKNAHMQLDPYGAAAGETANLRFLELAANGTDYTGFKAPDAIALGANAIYTLPTGYPGSTAFLKSGSTGSMSWDTSTYLTGNQTITLSGDASGSGATSISVTLANTGVTAGSYGSASQVGTFTVDSKGRLTAAGSTSIAIGASAITSGTLAVARGGTGQSANLTAGGIVYGSSTTAMGCSVAGTSGRALVSGGTGSPTWFAPTAGSLVFAGTSGVLAEDNANLSWDNTNDDLTVTNPAGYPAFTVQNESTGTVRLVGSGVVVWNEYNGQAIGLEMTTNSALSTASQWGIYNYVGSTTDSGQVTGMRSVVDSTGSKYGLYVDTGSTTTAGTAYGLYVLADGTGTKNGIYLDAGATTSVGVAYGCRAYAYSSDSSVYGGYFVGNGTTTGTSYGCYADGEQFDFYAAGAGTDYGSASSRRWKRDVVPIPGSLEKVRALRGVYFTWDEEHGGGHDLGMIAEEVGEVLPEIVQYEAGGVDANAMDYSRLGPVLVEAVKELASELDERDRRLAALEERLDRLAAATGHPELAETEVPAPTATPAASAATPSPQAGSVGSTPVSVRQHLELARRAGLGEDLMSVVEGPISEGASPEELRAHLEAALTQQEAEAIGTALKELIGPAPLRGSAVEER